jgi:hypothetical protein
MRARSLTHEGEVAAAWAVRTEMGEHGKAANGGVELRGVKTVPDCR